MFRKRTFIHLIRLHAIPKMAYQTLWVTHQMASGNTGWRSGSYIIVVIAYRVVPVSLAGCTAFLLYSTLNTLSFHSNTHTLTLDWICPQYLPCMQDLPYHLSPHAVSPLLPESFANLSSRPRSGWQQHQIPFVTKIIEGRFEQAVTARPLANANSDLLSVLHDVRSGTRSSAVHTSSLRGCLIRSVWAPHSHGNQSVKRDG